MKRPAACFALWMIIGIIAGQYTPSVGGIALFCVALLGILTFIYWQTRKKEVLWIPVAFLWGLILIFDTVPDSSDELIERWIAEEKNVQITGIVSEYQETSRDSLRITVQTDVICADEVQIKERKKIQFFYDGEAKLGEGSQIEVKGVLVDLLPATNPGGFDEARYYRTRGVDWQLDLTELSDTGIQHSHPMHFICCFRENIIASFHAIFPQREAGLVEAMVTGQKTGMDPELKELYSYAGISHILAVSGLHVSVMAGMIKVILERMFRMKKCTSALITIGFMCCFLIFTGAPASAVRAVIMITIFLGGSVIMKDSDGINSLGTAAVILLSVQPLYLWDAGFQFSFITTLAILLANNITNRSKNLPNWARYLFVSITASAASFPLNAWYFYFIPFHAIFINILILPLMSVVTCMGFFSGILGMFWIQAGEFLGGTVFILLRFYEAVCTFFVDLKWFLVTTGKPSLWVLVLFYGLLLEIFFYRKSTIRLAGILATLTAVIFTINDRGERNTAEAAFLDVGQGDAIVLHQGSDTCFVVDTGGWYWAEENKNTGNKVILPYLAYKGIVRIDGLFLTHMDYDHAGGALELLDLIEVRCIYVSACDEEDELFTALKQKAEALQIPIKTVLSGDKIEGSHGLSISCLWPKQANIWAESNEQSLVLKAVYGEVSMLLTGDAGIEEEEKILRAGDEISAQVLKLGHHGSKNSSSQDFLETVNPEIAIISSGKNNRYGHPDKETMLRLEQVGIESLNTSADGAVLIKTDGKDLKIRSMIGGNLCRN